MPDTQSVTTQSVQAPQLTAPNLYALAGGGLHIHYTTNGFDDKPHFTYQDAQRTLTFSGSQIRTTNVPDIGGIVSVTLVLTVDSGSTTFSLLLPAVRMVGGAGASMPISTDGITTFHHFSVVPSLNHGQQEFYAVTPLTGTASHVFF